MYSMVLVAVLASSPVVPDCHGRHGCHGCYGCYGCYGGCYGCYGGGGAEPIAPPKKAAAAAPARLIVQLPADAQLFLDDQPTNARAAERTFVTPNLEPGYLYTYTVRAEITRDGQKHIETKKVDVTAGRVSQLSFTEAAMIRADSDQAVASAGR